MTRYNANKLPQNPGPAGWNCLLQQPSPAIILDKKLSADYFVVGGGFAGLSAAYRLSAQNPSAKIILVDAGRIGEGPAGRNSGFMIDLPHDLSSDDYAGQNFQQDIQQTELNRKAIAFASDIAAEHQFKKEVFDPSGKINGAASEKGHQHNLEYETHLKRMDEKCEMLDKVTMAECTGSDYYLSGLYTPGTVMLQPAAYIRGVADSLHKKISIFENSPLLSLESANKKWQAKTPEGSITANKIVLAVNGHAESFGFFRRRLMHVFTYASITYPMTPEQRKKLGGIDKWSLTPADPMGVTVRRICGSSGDRIVIRSRFTYDPSMVVNADRLKKIGQLHKAQFKARFPKISEIQMEHCWGGHLCLSRNGVPAFGEIEENLFSACCQNGLGVVKGTLSGMAAADLASNTHSDIAESLLAMENPAKLPPEPFAWMGINAVMRYKELQAGKEL